MREVRLTVLPEKFQKLGFSSFPVFKTPKSWMNVVGGHNLRGLDDFDISLPYATVNELGFEVVDQYAREIEAYVLSKYPPILGR